MVRAQGFRAFARNVLIHLRSEVGGSIYILLARMRYNYYVKNLLEVRENRRTLEATKRMSGGQGDSHPLVSVLIPTFNRGRILVDRAIASVLRQSYQNFEVIIVGDHCTDGTDQLVRSINDRRIRFYNLPEKTQYPPNPRKRWMTAGAEPRNKALELCSGNWIAPLDDDDEFTDNHIQVLLSYAMEHCCDVVYGKVLYESIPDKWIEVGSYPLAFGAISHISVLYSSKLRFLRYDADCWRCEETADWNMWRRMKSAGARIGFVNEIVGRYYLCGSRKTAYDNRVHAKFWCNLARCFGVPD